MSSEQITLDANNATAMLLEGFEVEPGSVFESKVRQAYLLGRTHAALENFDTVLKYVRSRTLTDDLKDSLTLVRAGK